VISAFGRPWSNVRQWPPSSKVMKTPNRDAAKRICGVYGYVTIEL